MGLKATTVLQFLCSQTFGARCHGWIIRSENSYSQICFKHNIINLLHGIEIVVMNRILQKVFKLSFHISIFTEVDRYEHTI